MSRARDFADLASSYSAGGITGKNLIINGSMICSQRGTSETGVTGVKYANAPDRFKAQITTAGTWTLSQSSTAPDGFANSYKWDCTTADASLAAGDAIQIAHKVEAQNLRHLQYGLSGAQAITVSFYVRSNKTGTYILEIFQEDSSRSISKSYTINSADAWERKVITILGDSSGTINTDTGVGFDMIWWLGAGTNFTSGTLATNWASISSANRAVGQVNLADNTANEWYITGVQLEVGEQATPFEHRSYGDELARCQRYFQIIPSNSAAYSFPLVRHRSATNSYTGSSYYPVTMRTNATMTLDTSGSWIHKPNTRQDTGSATVVSSSSSVFTVVAVPSTEDSTQYLAFSNNNVEADAEL